MMRIKFFLVFLFGIISVVSFAQKKRYDLNHYEGLPSNYKINDILLSDGGSAYVATDKGLYFITSVGVEARDIVPNKQINSLSDSDDNLFYFGGKNKVSSSIQLGKSISFGNNSVQVSSLENFKNELWVGTNDGIYVINKKRNKVKYHYIPSNSKLISKKINFLYEDKKNVMWVGTKNGIIMIKDGDWSIYEKRHSMEGIYEDKEGLWLLSNKELWNIDNIGKTNRWYRLNLKKDLKKGRVNDLVVDSRGRLIIASDILVRFNPVTDKIERYGQELGLVSKNCTSIAIDSDDRIWIGTGDSGLFTVGFNDHFKGKKRGAKLEFVLVSKSPSCNKGDDGSIKLIIKGGKKPYDINWSTGEKGVKSINNLVANNYSVTVVDAMDSTSTMNTVLLDPDPLKVKLGNIVDNTVGVGSVVNFEISGGTPGYRIDIDGYSYDNPAKNVGTGKHEAKIVDIFGCEVFVEFNVEGEQILSGLNASKMKVGQVLRINNLYFDADSTDITQKSIPVLDEIFLFLKTNENIIVEIGGHTNNIPSNEYCDKLSTERAKNVAEYMIRRGVPKSRISYKGYGKRKPIATNSTASGRKRNQRVEMKILSVGDK